MRFFIKKSGRRRYVETARNEREARTAMHALNAHEKKNGRPMVYYVDPPLQDAGVYPEELLSWITDVLGTEGYTPEVVENPEEQPPEPPPFDPERDFWC
jgi:hypothetical protein